MTVGYFKVLSLVLGGLMLLAAPFVYFLRGTMPKLFPEKRPTYMLIVGPPFVAFCAFTWYMYAVTDVPYSWIIAVYVSLGGLKSLGRLFAYPTARKNVLAFYAKGAGTLAAVGAAGVAMGAGPIYLGIYVY